LNFELCRSRQGFPRLHFSISKQNDLSNIEHLARRIVDSGEAFGLVDGIDADLRTLSVDCSLLVAIFVLAIFFDIFGL
jgi:hypothetical protein